MTASVLKQDPAKWTWTVFTPSKDSILLDIRINVRGFEYLMACTICVLCRER